MEDILFAALDDGVAGVVAALAADHDVSVAGQNVDDLAFTFIAPLRADQDRICHRITGGERVAGDLHQAFVATARNDRMTRPRRKLVLWQKGQVRSRIGKRS